MKQRFTEEQIIGFLRKADRELVRWMGTRGLSGRRCLGVVGMSASALRYEPRPDRNVALRAQIVALAQRATIKIGMSCSDSERLRAVTVISSNRPNTPLSDADPS